MDKRIASAGLRLVRAIEGSPRLRALLSALGYTQRDQRLGWRLVAHTQRGSASQRLILHAFLQAWAPTARRLVEREVRVRRR